MQLAPRDRRGHPVSPEPLAYKEFKGPRALQGLRDRKEFRGHLV